MGSFMLCTTANKGSTKEAINDGIIKYENTTLYKMHREFSNIISVQQRISDKIEGASGKMGRSNRSSKFSEIANTTRVFDDDF